MAEATCFKVCTLVSSPDSPSVLSFDFNVFRSFYKSPFAGNRKAAFGVFNFTFCLDNLGIDKLEKTVAYINENNSSENTDLNCCKTFFTDPSALRAPPLT